MSWDRNVVKRIQDAFAGQGEPHRAEGAGAYMKHVAPFLGIAAPERRRLLRAALSGVPVPTETELGQAARRLIELPEREYHYAAYDLFQKYLEVVGEDFLEQWVEPLLTITPWWDTLDGFTTAAIAPLCQRYEQRALIERWSGSGNRWLIRAAIQHQRGAKEATDVPYLLALCGRHWEDPEFFVAKAIGWALRDLARMDPDCVKRFLAERTHRNAVAEREARKGIGYGEKAR